MIKEDASDRPLGLLAACLLFWRSRRPLSVGRDVLDEQQNPAPPPADPLADDVCRCACHIHPELVHFIPCCVVCSACKQRIRTDAMKRHELTHRDENVVRRTETSGAPPHS